MIGFLLCFKAISKPMRSDASSVGFFDSAWGRHPRRQLLSVGELLQEKRVGFPRAAGANATFGQAAKRSEKAASALELFDS